MTSFFQTRGSSLFYRMIEAAFRLEHYNDPLPDKIIKLGEEIEDKNKFVWDVLRYLVTQHLNLSSISDSRTRQKLIDKFNLGDNSALLSNSDIAERRYLPKVRNKFLPPSKSVSVKRK